MGKEVAFIKINAFFHGKVVRKAVWALPLDIGAISALIAPGLALSGATDFGRIATGYIISTGFLRMVQPAGFFSFVKANESSFVEDQSRLANTFEAARGVQTTAARAWLVDAFVIVVASPVFYVVMMACKSGES